MTSRLNRPSQNPNIELTMAADFRAALREFLRRTEEVAAANGLTSRRYDLLLQIHAGGKRRNESTVKELTERLSLGQTAVTELVKRAEEASLVTRRRDSADRRVWRLRLTRDGQRRVLATFDELRSDRRALVETFARASQRLRAIAPPPSSEGS